MLQQGLSACSKSYVGLSAGHTRIVVVEGEVLVGKQSIRESKLLERKLMDGGRG